MTAADALRRLLADVRAARDWKRAREPVACLLAGETRPMLSVALSADIDYLERLALDGLAGEVRRDWTEQPDGIPIEPTNEGQP